jgi:xanthine dehydrogenase accessory factor
MCRWADEKRPFVLARVTSTWGSAPRQVGAAMGIVSSETFAGSVSGGCVEGAVVQEAISLLETPRARSIEYGVDDETAWSVGLSCGGRIELLLERFPLFSEARAEREVGSAVLKALLENRMGALVTIITPEAARHLFVRPDGSFDGEAEWVSYVDDAVEAIRFGRSRWVRDSPYRVFVDVFEELSRLVVIGSGDIARHLVRFGSFLDFETIVVDPRSAFLQHDMFDVQPDRMICDWPGAALRSVDLGPGTYCVLLSHNPRIDDEALHALLASDVSYIGALGSRRTHERRCRRMEEAGFGGAVIQRIKGPVGLPIGAATPSEIALAVVAELIQEKRQRGAR